MTAIMTRMHVEKFARMLDIVKLRLYQTTQDTIEGLKDISKEQKNQAYPEWVVTCILDNLLGGRPFWIDGPRCSTNLCNSLLVKHVDWTIPNIQGREEDASTLVESFRKLRDQLNNADEIQKRIQYEKMMEFYLAYQRDQTKDIDPHIWAKLIVFLENNIWTRIKAVFVGKESITTALETLGPETMLLQLIISFLEYAEGYFSQILSNLEEIELELNQLRQKAEEHKGWNAIGCIFWRPSSRSWTKQLQPLSHDDHIIIPKVQEGQRKIGMEPHVEEDWE